jgi:hypothetical protein
MKLLKNALPGLALIISFASVAFAQEHGGQLSLSLPNGWQTLRLGARDVFKVALPKAPESKTEDNSGDGINMQTTYYSVDSDDIFMAIADVHNLPMTAEQMSDENRIFFFAKVRDGLVQGIKSGLEKTGLKLEVKFFPQKSLAFKGMKGYEQDLLIGTFKGRARMLPKNDHIFIFFTLLMPEKNEALMSSFLDSFEYVGSIP